jgi:hypothetical protein
VGVTRALLASISADCRPLDAVAAADVMAAGTTGMPLLQLAVRTQSKVGIRRAGGMLRFVPVVSGAGRCRMWVCIPMHALMALVG